MMKKNKTIKISKEHEQQLRKAAKNIFDVLIQHLELLCECQEGCITYGKEILLRRGALIDSTDEKMCAPYSRYVMIHNLLFPVNDEEKALPETLKLWCIDEALTSYEFVHRGIRICGLLEDPDEYMLTQDEHNCFNRVMLLRSCTNKPELQRYALILALTTEAAKQADTYKPLAALKEEVVLLLNHALQFEGTELMPNASLIKCYLLADFSEALCKECECSGMFRNEDGSYYALDSEHHVFIEVKSYTHLLQDFRTHRASLDKKYREF